MLQVSCSSETLRPAQSCNCVVSTAPIAFNCHLELLQTIQQPQPEHDVAVRAVRVAHALVRDMLLTLAQANQQLIQAQAQLQQTIPAQQERWQRVWKLQVQSSVELRLANEGSY